jgi:hypothetical protein
MNPFIAPIDFNKNIKVSTSIWMKRSNLFPAFNGWSVGNGSFTCSYKDIVSLINLIKNQHEHHKKISFEDEYRKLLLEYGITPYDKCTTGKIHSIVAYLWAFIASTEYFPELMESLASVKDLNTRFSLDETDSNALKNSVELSQ